MALTLYNTLTNKKEPFVPTEAGKVKIYLCGPTVYDLLHIGNFRGAIVYNMIRNWLEHLGYQVTFVYNYTDVDDKIIKLANEEGVDSKVISERYIAEFEKDFAALGLRQHDHNPRVTEFIPQIVEIVEKLIANKKAYVVDGEVFYDVHAFAGYGKLSKKNLEDLEAGHRVEVDQKKKHPADFVLWKPSKAGEPAWDSPWGAGRPGWHIECSAMIRGLLGETIDIHGGGIDLIFPHHENEIAQGEGATGKCYCKYWVHNAFINMGDEKMSKSLGNIVTGRSFMEEYDPEILKYIFLSAHYRTTLSVTEDKVEQTIAALARIYSALQIADWMLSQAVEGEGKARPDFLKFLEETDKKIADAMNEDFNTSVLISSVFEVVRKVNGMNLHRKKITADAVATLRVFREWVRKYGTMAALFQRPPEEMLNQLESIMLRLRKVERAEVEQLIEQRNRARDEKDWEASDKIRDRLQELGIEPLDGNPFRAWEVK